jgi:defect-in-organelle-trafficking protein DotC
MEKKLVTFIGIIGALLLLVGCAKVKAPEPAKIDALETTNTNGAAKSRTMRMEVVKETAHGLGAQAALSWHSYYINLMLEKQKRNLDHIFNFNYLILEHNVLPPILVEGRNILNLADNFSIRVSDREYQIAQQPRFVTAPPNWRNYLWMPYKKPEEPNITLLPQNKQERELWNIYIKIGWNDGTEQASQIFNSNLAKLKRDYEGMILYRKLLAQQMVTAPHVAKTDLGITGSGSDIQINDRLLRITAVSHLNTEAKTWQPAATVNGKEKSPLLKELKGGKTLMDKI